MVVLLRFDTDNVLPAHDLSVQLYVEPIIWDPWAPRATVRGKQGIRDV